jgi:hypothetical protein
MPVHANQGFWANNEMLNTDEALTWAMSEFPDAPEDDGDLQESVKKTGRIGEKYELAHGNHGHYVLPDSFRDTGDHGIQVDIIRMLVVAEYREFSMFSLNNLKLTMTAKASRLSTRLRGPLGQRWLSLRRSTTLWMSCRRGCQPETP